jgi:hypothetical protein
MVASIVPAKKYRYRSFIPPSKEMGDFCCKYVKLVQGICSSDVEWIWRKIYPSAEKILLSQVENGSTLDKRGVHP